MSHHQVLFKKTDTENFTTAIFKIKIFDLKYITNIYIYIYREREREREQFPIQEAYVYIYICIYICVCVCLCVCECVFINVYIYIYISKERESSVRLKKLTCVYIQGVPGGMCESSGECSLC